jgi:hypothetical protein
MPYCVLQQPKKELYAMGMLLSEDEARHRSAKGHGEGDLRLD